MAFSHLLLLRHFTTKHHLIFLSPHHLFLRHSSSLSSDPPPYPPKPASLTARLSFVFDKIDQLEKDRAEKDDALHRIRAWRQSKQPPPPPPPSNDVSDDDGEIKLGFSREVENEKSRPVVVVAEGRRGEIEVAHPWPEWVELMERLVKQNYFDHRREDEDKMIQSVGDVVGEIEDKAELDFNFTRDWKTVHTAMINFGKDRFDIFRSLSRQDIQKLVGYGCPSADKKVVFSSKLLRKHAHLDEGDVCSSCSLRNTCERAYLITNKEDEARTIDMMRVLMAYGFDHINGSVENKSLLKQKSIKTVVRKLLHEIVKLSAVPIDPSLPPPVIKKRPPKVKQPPPPPKRRVGRDDVEMKKGDWLCPKCNFMNFAKNSVCLQCDAKRPKRQLLPGEWECPQCDFLNYRRNMTCFNCEHKRPPDNYVDNQDQGRQNRQPSRMERVPDREQVSNAWNFDFDDDESDGADVAAFEYADPRAMNEDRHLDRAPEGHFGRPQQDYGVGSASRFQEQERARPAQMKHNMGFNDFADEEDDIDNYELESPNRNERQDDSTVRFSDVENEGYTESEGDDDLVGFSGRSSTSNPRSSKPSHRENDLSHARDDDLDFDSDEDLDLPVHPKWKSSHVADSGLRDRSSHRRSKQSSFDSDDDGSSEDHHEERFARRPAGKSFGKSDKQGFRQAAGFDNGFKSRQGRGSYRDSDETAFTRSEEFNRNREQKGGRRVSSSVKGNGRSSGGSRGRREDFGDDFGGPSRGSHGRRDDFSNDFDRPSRGSRGNQRGSSSNERDQHKMNGRQRGAQNFNRFGQRGGAGDRGRRRSNEADGWSDVD